MIVYWTTYLVPALLSLRALSSNSGSGRLLNALIFTLLFLIIGFRQTGGDYTRYEIMFERLTFADDFLVAISSTEPVYGLLNWVVFKAGFSFSGVVLICALIYLYCLWRFIYREPIPTLALAVATSYLTIVVATGYMRQGVAISLLMLSTIYARDRRPIATLITLATAVGFHVSAIVGVIILATSFETKFKSKGFIFAGIIILGVSALAYLLFQNKFNWFALHYLISDRYTSMGALQRLSLSWVAAILILWFSKNLPRNERVMWSYLALFSLSTILLLSLSSTIADRIGLYTIIIQIVAFGRLPLFIKIFEKKVTIIPIISLYLAVLGTWMLFGQFADELWLPYKSSIFGEIK